MSMIILLGMVGLGNSRQMSKITKIIMTYDNYVRSNEYTDEELKVKTDDVLKNVCDIRIGNIVTFNRLIETALDIKFKSDKYKNSNPRYVRKFLNVLYRYDKDKFLINFNKI